TRPPGTYEMRLRAAEDTKAYDDWLHYQRHAMKLMEPGLRERLLERHRQVGPLSQYHDLKAIDAFDVPDRLATLKPTLLVLRGMDDPTNPPEYEKEIHDSVPGSRYVKLSGAGHFPPTEIPDKVNALIEEFVAALGGNSAGLVLLERVRGQHQAVARALGHPEPDVLALREIVEEIAGCRVD